LRIVIPSSDIALARAAGSYLLARRTVAPHINVMIRSEMPTMCEIGRTIYTLSLASILRNQAVVFALTRRFPWVSITPFGVPVVPEV